MRSVSLHFIESGQKKTFRELKLNIVINQIYANNLVIIAKISIVHSNLPVEDCKLVM